MAAERRVRIRAIRRALAAPKWDVILPLVTTALGVVCFAMALALCNVEAMGAAVIGVSAAWLLWRCP